MSRTQSRVGTGGRSIKAKISKMKNARKRAKKAARANQTDQT